VPGSSGYGRRKIQGNSGAQSRTSYRKSGPIAHHAKQILSPSVVTRRSPSTRPVVSLREAHSPHGRSALGTVRPRECSLCSTSPRPATKPSNRPGSPLGEAAAEEVGDLGPCGSGPRHMPGMLAHRRARPGSRLGAAAPEEVGDLGPCEPGRARHWARRPRRKSAISAGASPAGLAIGRGGPGGSRRSRPVRLRPAAHARHAAERLRRSGMFSSSKACFSGAA
jgi:hypothetical protein